MRKLVSATVAALFTCVGLAQAAEPLKIRMAWIVPASNIASILFAKPALAKHLGKSYTMEPVRFQGSPPMITALAVDDVDIALLGYSSISLAVQNAGLGDLRIVADEFQDGVGDYYSNEFFVRNDSGIKAVADLKGKVIGTNAAGSAVDIGARAMLRDAHLEDRRDYTVIEGSFPAMKAMLAEKKVDMIPSVVPFSNDAALRSVAHVLFTQKDAMGPSSLGIWVVRKAFLEKNRAALVDFLEDSLVETRWYLDPANHAEAVQIAASFAKSPPALFESWLFTKKDYFRDPNLLPNVDEIQSNVDMMRKLGLVTSQLDVKQYVDVSLVKEAAARLK